jgi:hypothetical protein
MDAGWFSPELVDPPYIEDSVESTWDLLSFLTESLNSDGRGRPSAFLHRRVYQEADLGKASKII